MQDHEAVEITQPRLGFQERGSRTQHRLAVSGTATSALIRKFQNRANHLNSGLWTHAMSALVYAGKKGAPCPCLPPLPSTAHRSDLIAEVISSEGPKSHLESVLSGSVGY